VAEGFSGEPGVAHGLLEQCSKRVPELVGVKHLDAELLRELAVHVLRTGDGDRLELVALFTGCKPMNRAGEGSSPVLR
jgi:hypothetical protein